MDLDDTESLTLILKCDYHIVVLIGPPYVGKTALVYRYIINELPLGFTPTVGVEFTKKVITDPSNLNKFQLHI